MSPAPLRIVIVGGVAAGMSAATRARRMNENAQITVIERGGFVSFANCGLPYHVAGRIVHEEKLLVVSPARLKERFNIDIRLHTEALAIDRAAKTLRVRDLTPGGNGVESTIPYDKLILTPGASPIIPPMDGLKSANVFSVRSIEDTRAVQVYLAAQQPRRAVVVGGGFIGLEMAEALHDRGLAVTIVEKAPHVLPQMDAELSVDIEHELALHHLAVITGSGLAGVKHAAGKVTAVILEDGREVPVDVVILSIGVKPNVELAQAAGLKIGLTGAIAVDAHERTSDPDIYAAGDAAEVVHAVTGKAARVPLAGPANRAGRLAGEHAALGAGAAARSHSRAGGVVGTAIVQVFTLEAGMTGLSESAARTAGFDTDTAYITANNHAGYYPGASPIRLKLVYERPGGRILGAQAVGHAGVDKRLDVLATVLHFRGTIHDLAELDLAYAPQFGSAKDPIHMAAFVAENQQSGLTPAIGPGDIDGRQLVDVRTADEFSKGHFAQAVNIPVDALRQRSGELDASRPTAVICQGGLRGHVAVRMLKQKGFADVVNIKGGWDLARRLKPPI